MNLPSNLRSNKLRSKNLFDSSSNLLASSLSASANFSYKSWFMLEVKD